MFNSLSMWKSSKWNIILKLESSITKILQKMIKIKITMFVIIQMVINIQNFNNKAMDSKSEILWQSKWTGIQKQLNGPWMINFKSLKMHNFLQKKVEKYFHTLSFGEQEIKLNSLFETQIQKMKSKYFIWFLISS